MDGKDVTYNLNRKKMNIIITIVRCNLLSFSFIDNFVSEISKPQN